MSEENKTWISVVEAADLSGEGKSWIYARIREGTIASTRSKLRGKRLLVSFESLCAATEGRTKSDRPKRRRKPAAPTGSTVFSLGEKVPEGYLPMKEAADLTGISYWSIRNACRAGRVKSLTVPSGGPKNSRRIYVDMDSLASAGMNVVNEPAPKPPLPPQDFAPSTDGGKDVSSATLRLLKTLSEVNWKGTGGVVGSAITEWQEAGMPDLKVCPTCGQLVED